MIAETMKKKPLIKTRATICNNHGLFEKHYYDRRGNLLSLEMYYESDIEPGKYSFKYIWEYDENNNIIYTKGESNRGIYELSYEYDELNRIVKYNQTIDGKRCINYIYEGNTMTAKDEDGNIKFKATLDENGNEIAKYEYDYKEDGELYEYYREQHEYDNRNNRIYSAHYDHGCLDDIHIFKYNEDGNCVLAKQFTIADGTELETRMEYDSNGNLIHQYDSDGFEVRFEYDEYGNMIRSINEYEERTYEYTYYED